VTSRYGILARYTRWPATALSAIIFAVLLARTSVTLLTGEWAFAGGAVLGCLAAGILYIIAHLMRAFRLAVIAMPLTGASFRTIVLLHLYVAPWSLIMPLKIDEIIRFGELARISKSWSRPLIVLLIDRSMDGAILIGMALLLLASGGWSVAAPVAVIGVCLSLLVLAFFILPVLLQQVQRHIFVNHYQERALRALALVAKVRGALEISRQAISAAPAFLVLGTIGIWSMELVAMAVLLAVFEPSSISLPETIEVALARADASWRVMLLGQQPSAAIQLATFVFFDALLLAWIWVPLPYIRRQVGEPRRLRLPTAKSGFSFSTIEQV